jgi:1-deoxy-D-xylulose-5-phosphate reductoisomerase
LERARDIAGEFGVQYLSVTGKKTPARPFPGIRRLPIEELVSLDSVDHVIVAIPGLTALRPLLSALGAGKKIALANKESVVVAGHLLRRALQTSKATLLPVDSEHSGIFQCLGSRTEVFFSKVPALKKIWLTASGGPFRDLTVEQLSRVTVADALRHPTWSMGAKISVDSATLANKGLEKIEAGWFYDIEPAEIDAVIHRESIVHGLVEFCDGTMLAQLSPSSMEFPIAHCLDFPKKSSVAAAGIDLLTLGALHFEAPDRVRFPCLALAEAAFEAGRSSPCDFEGANRVAVEAFLREDIAFMDIPKIIGEVLSTLVPVDLPDLTSVEERYVEVRRRTLEKISRTRR